MPADGKVGIHNKINAYHRFYKGVAVACGIFAHEAVVLIPYALVLTETIAHVQGEGHKSPFAEKFIIANLYITILCLQNGVDVITQGISEIFLAFVIRVGVANTREKIGEQLAVYVGIAGYNA